MSSRKLARRASRTAFGAEVELKRRGPGVAGPRSILTAAATDIQKKDAAKLVARVRALRKKGLTVSEIAKRVDRTERRVSRILNPKA